MLALPHVKDVRGCHRGVYKLRGRVCGRNAYLGVTSFGTVLHGGVFMATEEQSDAELCLWLRDELNRTDPARGSHLKLLPRSVTASVDGPSPTHPQIAAADNDLAAELRAAIEATQRARLAGEDMMRNLGVMPDVARRLSSLLAESA